MKPEQTYCIHIVKSTIVTSDEGHRVNLCGDVVVDNAVKRSRRFYYNVGKSGYSVPAHKVQCAKPN